MVEILRGPVCDKNDPIPKESVENFPNAMVRKKKVDIGVLGNICRGCGGEFKQLIKHLKPTRFKTGKCMQKYEERERLRCTLNPLLRGIVQSTMKRR